MARKNRNGNDKKTDITTNRRFLNITKQINNIMGQANLDLYGTDRVSQTEALNQSFQALMQEELTTLTGKSEGDNSSFLAKLSSNDRKATATINQLISSQFMDMDGSQNSMLQGFIEDAYKNRLIEQSDLHEVASQLIELSEAILITRDAIVTADVVEGRLGRTLEFENADENDSRDYIPLVEKMEKKFKLQEKIKSFIVTRTLEYGEFYAYTIPYSKLFNDFSNLLNNYGVRKSVNRVLKESTSTLLEYVSNTKNADIITESVFNGEKPKYNSNKTLESFSERVYAEYCASIEKEKKGHNKSTIVTEQAPDKEAFCADLDNIMSRISISNDPVPIPILEEGAVSLEFFKENYFNESTGQLMTEAPNTKKQNKSKSKSNKPENKFNQVLKSVSDAGVQFDNSTTRDKDGNPIGRGENFDNITDCYIKLINPTQIVPVKIINKTIGYYYIQSEAVTPLSGTISANLYYSKFDENVRQQTIIDSLANAIVSSFNKKFLEENEKFKETIVEAIHYYNLNERRIKFQYIPVEYMQAFKIDEDENGDGTSMIKKSLFYAKLYLMILLFKIMSILLNSNDQKVNYIKSSGIDKNVANKVQELARIKQSRQINIYDLFNYTTIINKVGAGNEVYVPTGRSGERPIETEILSGQDVQLNNDLLEMLKNSYILATGVPAAIVNYLNEADFAKVVEQNNTKFMARVVNYQLDFNPAITSWYQMIMRSSTQIPPEYIDNFKFTLQLPRSANSNARADAIGSFGTYSDFVTQLIFGDNSDGTIPPEQILSFKQKLADEQMPMLNVQHLMKLAEEAKLEATQKQLKPDAANGDSGDDIGLDDLS